LIQHVNGQSEFLCHFLCAIGHRGRRHVTARFVRHVAREVRRFADNAAAFSATLERFLVRAFDYDFEAINLSLLFFFGAVLIGLE